MDNYVNEENDDINWYGDLTINGNVENDNDSILSCSVKYVNSANIIIYLLGIHMKSNNQEGRVYYSIASVRMGTRLNRNDPGFYTFREQEDNSIRLWRNIQKYTNATIPI